MDSPRLRRSILFCLASSMRSARVDMGTPVAVRFVPTVVGQFAGVGIAAAIGAAKADVGRLGGRIDRNSEYWFKRRRIGEPSWRRCERTCNEPFCCRVLRGDNQDNYNVLENGVVVGRIFKAQLAPQDRPWMWASGHRPDSAPHSISSLMVARSCLRGVLARLYSSICSPPAGSPDHGCEWRPFRWSSIGHVSDTI
jgi:hypothetical protein